MKFRLIIAVPVFLVLALTLSVIMLAGCGTKPETGSSIPTFTKLFLANKENGVVVFNLDTLNAEMNLTFPKEVYIYGVAVSPDKKTLYAIGSDVTSEIFACDLETLAVTSISIDKTDSKAFTTACNDILAASPDGRRIFASAGYYVAGIFSFTVDPFTLEAYVTAEGNPGNDWSEGMAVSQDSRYVYFVDNGATTKSIMKYVVGAKTIEASVPIPNNGSAEFIRLSLDGKKLYVPAGNLPGGSGEVCVLDLNTFTFDPVLIPAGEGPHDIAVTSKGKGYTVNYGDDTVTVIDLKTNTVITTLTLEVASWPYCAITDDARNRVYVNGFNDSKLYVINTITDSLEGVYELPSETGQVSPASVHDSPPRRTMIAF